MWMPGPGRRPDELAASIVGRGATVVNGYTGTWSKAQCKRNGVFCEERVGPASDWLRCDAYGITTGKAILDSVGSLEALCGAGEYSGLRSCRIPGRHAGTRDWQSEV